MKMMYSLLDKMEAKQLSSLKERAQQIIENPDNF